MKKKLLSTLALVLVLALIPTFAFAKKSHQYGDGGDGITSGGSSTIVGNTGVSLVPEENCPNENGPAGTCQRHTDVETQTLTNGQILTTTGATRDHRNVFYRLAMNMLTTNGTPITKNNDGGVKIGNVHVHFASDFAEIAGLWDYAVADIVALNSGKTAAEVFGNTLGVDLTGWKSVGNTRAVILTDETTGLTNTGAEFHVAISPIEPNGQFAVVYYDNWTGRWNFMPVTLDPATGLIKMYLPGSCTVQLLQKV